MRWVLAVVLAVSLGGGAAAQVELNQSQNLMLRLWRTCLGHYAGSSSSWDTWHRIRVPCVSEEMPFTSSLLRAGQNSTQQASLLAEVHRELRVTESEIEALLAWRLGAGLENHPQALRGAVVVWRQCVSEAVLRRERGRSMEGARTECVANELDMRDLFQDAGRPDDARHEVRATQEYIAAAWRWAYASLRRMPPAPSAP